jgi:signal transduction histidine kinase
MSLQLKIAHKGLILTAVPLLFEIVFVGLLALMVHRADDIAQQALRSREISAELHELEKDFFDAGVALTLYRYSHSDKVFARFDRVVQQIPAHFDSLDKLTAGNARQRQHISKMKPLYEKAIAALQDIRADMYRRTRSDQERESFLHPARPALDERAGVFERSQIPKMIFSTLGPFLDEVHTLEDEPVGGGDEIAQLDQVFHDVAKALVESDKVKQEFVSMISHDLRTPLTSLQAALALCLKGKYGALNDAGVERLTKAEKNVAYLINLINELLDIEKMDAGMVCLQKQPVNLREFIISTTDVLHSYAEQRNISLEHEGDDVVVLADSKRLAQVITNLVSNAIKYSPDGGTVKIAARFSAADKVEISISDDGPGVPSEYRDKIFDRFEQIDLPEHQRGGSVLGLAICKMIVEAHGGEIGVRSQPGTASCFWFTLPAAEGASGCYVDVDRTPLDTAVS